MVPNRDQRIDVTKLLTSWDKMSEHFLAGRAQLLQTGIDWIEQRTPQSIVELGSGPGTILRKVRARIPDVDLVGIDRDPVLRRLHEAATPSQERIRLIDADLSVPSWTSAVTAVTDPDVVIAAQVLHYFAPERFDGLLREIRQLIGPGGALVHLDHVPSSHSDDAHVGAAHHSAQYEDSLRAGDPWSRWWKKAADLELLTEPLSERAETADSGAESAEYHPAQSRLLQHLSDAGFHDFEQHRIGSSMLTIATTH